MTTLCLRKGGHTTTTQTPHPKLQAQPTLARIVCELLLVMLTGHRADFNS